VLRSDQLIPADTLQTETAQGCEFHFENAVNAADTDLGGWDAKWPSQLRISCQDNLMLSCQGNLPHAIERSQTQPQGLLDNMVTHCF
jgi:hypothetical protein